MSQASSTSVSGNVSFGDSQSSLWLVGIGAAVLVLIVWVLNRK
jgi:hypothetical protein